VLVAVDIRADATLELNTDVAGDEVTDAGDNQLPEYESTYTEECTLEGTLLDLSDELGDWDIALTVVCEEKNVLLMPWILLWPERMGRKDRLWERNWEDFFLDAKLTTSSITQARLKISER